MEFFPLNTYDFLKFSFSYFVFYLDLTKKYFYKPFYSCNKYESNFYELDSFLTIGLLFRQIFRNSIYL